MLSAMSFQFTRTSPHTLWSVVGNVPLQQLAEAATLALIVGAGVKLRRDHALAGDPSRLAAIAAAVLLGIEISANYWNYMYLVWIAPFLMVSVLGVDAPLEHVQQAPRESRSSRGSGESVQPELDPSTHRAGQPM
jgi:hypothetical protein